MWTSSQAQNLTYCVSDGFGARQADIVAAMADGAEPVGGRLERGRTSPTCPRPTPTARRRNNSVLFSVEPTFTSEYIARAFFPSSPDSQRNVLVDDSL